MRFLVLFVMVTIVAGCDVFPPIVPETPLSLSWHRYEACVRQSKNSATQCQNLKVAYEAQLNRAQQ